MTSEDPVPKSSQRYFQHDFARSPSTARVAIAICVVIFIAAGFVACNCPGFFVVMGICSVVAFWAGTRTQRVIAGILFVLALTGAIFQFRGESLEKQGFKSAFVASMTLKRSPQTSDEEKPNKLWMATPTRSAGRGRRLYIPIRTVKERS